MLNGLSSMGVGAGQSYTSTPCLSVLKVVCMGTNYGDTCQEQIWQSLVAMCIAADMQSMQVQTGLNSTTPCTHKLFYTE